MPSNPHKCCKEVLQHFKGYHATCCKNRSSKVPGTYLNSYCKNVNTFNNVKMYLICYNFARALNRKEPYSQSKKNSSSSTSASSSVPGPQPQPPRDERMRLREQRLDNNFISSQPPPTSPVVIHTSTESPKVAKKSRRNPFHEKVIYHSKSYYKPFNSLKLSMWSHRQIRTHLGTRATPILYRVQLSQF